jgi:hypothetical protein
MRVAIFTDNDFDKVNGVTTTFRAALRSAPSGIHLRVYTAAAQPADTEGYLALRSIGMPIPFYREMRIYLPRLGEFLRRAPDESDSHRTSAVTERRPTKRRTGGDGVKASRGTPAQGASLSSTTRCWCRV